MIMRKNIFLALSLIVISYNALLCKVNNRPEELVIIGGGMVGGMEAYFAYEDAKKNNVPLHITVVEKNKSLAETTVSNIVPSLTCDEILAVVPRGQDLVKKLDILFSNPGGIRVDDVPGIQGTQATERFKEEAYNYSLDDQGHKQRTQSLLALGKMSMDLWQDIYNNADAEFKAILEASNFNPCREPLKGSTKVLHDGYRIDLIYNIPHAKDRALGMIHDYEALGYKNCALLTPNEVATLDPFLKDFCAQHSKNNVWHDDSVALWRPGGCLDAQVFLPKLYAYLKKHMGTNRFQIQFGKKVTGLEFSQDNTAITGLKFEDGQVMSNKNAHYVFCPGEAVGTLKALGLSEPAYAGFAGVSLLLNIDVPQNKLKEYASFNHCMEVHQEGVILAWQARFRDNKIFIGVAGTKAFYSDQRPTKDQAFAKNRNLLQLNMVNDVLPEFISLALNYDTKGKTLTEKDLDYLESKSIAKRWAGVRAVVYDGFPTLGTVYKGDVKIANARCTTHLGSGGGSFSPAAIMMSRNAMNEKHDEFTQHILAYGDSSRTAKIA